MMKSIGAVVAVALALLAAGCAERPVIGIVITNSPSSIECANAPSRERCR